MIYDLWIEQAEEDEEGEEDAKKQSDTNYDNEQKKESQGAIEEWIISKNRGYADQRKIFSGINWYQDNQVLFSSSFLITHEHKLRNVINKYDIKRHSWVELSKLNFHVFILCVL